MPTVRLDARLIGGNAGRWTVAALRDDLDPQPTVVCVEGGLHDVHGATLAALRELPALTIACSPDAPLDAFDLVADDDTRVEAWLAGFARAPLAAATAALLLRTAPRTTFAGLVAESSAYSMLQAGPEHRAWLASRCPSPADDGNGPRVRVEHDTGVTGVVLERGTRHNAFDTRMRDELHDVFSGLAASEDGDAIVWRADGPSFCSGGDLDQFGSAPDPATAHVVRLTRSVAVLVDALRDRVVVALHGACMGAGIELPAFAARVVAADDVRIALPELGLGLVPGAGGTVSLPRRTGRHRALDLLLTGETVGAEQALACGLVDEVVPRDMLVDRAYALAEGMEQA